MEKTGEEKNIRILQKKESEYLVENAPHDQVVCNKKRCGQKYQNLKKIESETSFENVPHKQVVLEKRGVVKEYRN